MSSSRRTDAGREGEGNAARRSRRGWPLRKTCYGTRFLDVSSQMRATLAGAALAAGIYAYYVYRSRKRAPALPVTLKDKQGQPVVVRLALHPMIWRR